MTKTRDEIEEKFAIIDATRAYLQHVYLDDAILVRARELVPEIKAWRPKGDEREHPSAQTDGLAWLFAKGMIHREAQIKAKLDRTQKKGEFTCRSGRFHVLDPFCSGSGVNVDVPKGTWEVCIVNRESWGIRTYGLMARLNPKLKIPTTKEEMKDWEDVGTVGVDAGTAGIFDVTRLPDRDSLEFAELKVLEHGCFSHSGDGDGGYGVYTHKGKDGQVDGVWIDYFQVAQR